MQHKNELLRFFEKFCIAVQDPRVQGRTKFPLLNVIVIGFCSVLAGAKSYVDMERFGLLHEDWFEDYLLLESGIPSHDTFRRVFSIIDAKEVERAFIAWARSAYAEKLRRISMDGKAVKGSLGGTSNNPVQSVGVFDHDSGLAIGQCSVENAGFGEIKGVLDLLNLLDIRKALVSVDAANSCPSVAREIKAHRANYIMPMRDTNTQYKPEAFALFNEHSPIDSAQSHDERHGRIEDRLCEVLPVALMSKEFRASYPSTKFVLRVTRARESIDYRFAVRETNADGKIFYARKSGEKRVSVREDFYITSKKMSAVDALFEIRDHWAIENKLHWHLDVAFGEDDWSVRDRVAVRNLSVLRKMAYNIVSKDPEKISMRLKTKSAAWSQEYFERYLFNPANFTA